MFFALIHAFASSLPLLGLAASKEFLQGLRQLCDEADALLVFDEVQVGLPVLLLIPLKGAGQVGQQYSCQWIELRVVLQQLYPKCS